MRILGRVLFLLFALTLFSSGAWLAWQTSARRNAQERSKPAKEQVVENPDYIPDKKE